MLSDQIQTQIITLTPAAIQAVRDLLKKRDLDGYALRVFVAGGGCSGLQYGMSLENNIRDQDSSWEFDGVKVVVDEISREYLGGSTVDFVESEKRSGFKIENPNHLSPCSPQADDGCSGCC